MKRLTWLLILAVCTALAQVQPVNVAMAPAEPCCCGDQGGACGMPDCGPVPTAPQCGATLPVATVQRAEAKRLRPAPRSGIVYFVVRSDSRLAMLPVRCVSRAGTPVVRVPLFAVHCSFLI
ncbi:MAG TPA: hypothetical protein VG734_23730 [Lacunisphaera sp.]|nr:hypothetical protein [Lacunisphaera sp.]